MTKVKKIETILTRTVLAFLLFTGLVLVWMIAGSAVLKAINGPEEKMYFNVKP